MKSSNIIKEKSSINKMIEKLPPKNLVCIYIFGKI